MLGNVWKQVRLWLMPSHHNDFHPHLIAERGLLILFALILGAEGFLVSNVVSIQAGTPSLAAVSAIVPTQMGGIHNQTAALPPFIADVGGYWSKYVALPIAQFTARPGMGKIALYVLLVLAAVLMGIVTLTLSMRHRHYKPVNYVAGGTMLAFAVTLLYFNTQVLFPYAASYQMASVATSVPPPPAITPTMSATLIATSTIQ